MSDVQNTISSDLEMQREYWSRLQEANNDFGFIVAEAFIRGIRDIGYKNTAYALDELIDNSIQAEAQNIHVVFESNRGKVTRIAVIDDGHGMDPEMLRLAVMWGGGHREGDRKGFGRYGYGLPSSCLSQGRCFTVISASETSQFHQITLDVDDMPERYIDPDNGRMIVPEAQVTELPQWLSGYDGMSHGTIVVIEKLDKLTWTSPTGLERNLLEQLGITYRNYLRQVNIIVVNDNKPGSKVEPLDPLFITPGFRYYDLDEDRAMPLDELVLEVKDREDKSVVGTVKVRFSYMGPTFSRKPEFKLVAGTSKRYMNARFSILKDYNGILVLRNGRQIDIVYRCPWLTFVNYDRFWKVEIDFDAALDEEFSITTSKQQIVISDRMWTLLEQAGVERAIKDLRRKFREEQSKWKTQVDEKLTADKKRASEQVMEAAEKFKPRARTVTPSEQAKRGKEGLNEEVRRQSRQTGKPEPEVKRAIEAEIQGHPYRVQTERAPGAPFFRVSQVGGQRVLYINMAHRFYTEVYAGPESTTRLRTALELLLWVLGESELDATGDMLKFYESERAAWSPRLNTLLDLLSEASDIEDELAAEEQTEEDENEAAEGTQSQLF